jgi:hypothetical protein
VLLLLLLLFLWLLPECMFEPLQAQSALWFNPCNVTRQQRNIKYIDLNTIIKAKESNMLLLPCCRSELQDKSQEEQEAIAEETRKEEQRLAHVVGVSSADLSVLGTVDRPSERYPETETHLFRAHVCTSPPPHSPPYTGCALYSPYRLSHVPRSAWS